MCKKSWSQDRPNASYWVWGPRHVPFQETPATLQSRWGHHFFFNAGPEKECGSAIHSPYLSVFSREGNGANEMAE